MSVEAMAAVLHHSKAKGTAKVVLLGVANHDGDGGAWPSIATLAKYANVDARSVQRAIRELSQAGELKVLIQAGGLAEMTDYLRPNRYEVTVSCPAECDGSTRHKVAASPGDANVTGSPDANVTPLVTPTSPKPSSEPSVGESSIGPLERGHGSLSDHGLPSGATLRVAAPEPPKIKPERKRRKMTKAERQNAWDRFLEMDLGDLSEDRETRGAAFLELESQHGAINPADWAQAMIDKGEWDGFVASFDLGNNVEVSFGKGA